MTIVEEVDVMDARPALLKRPALAGQRIDADEAVRKATSFLNRHLGHLLAAGAPQRVLFPLPATYALRRRISATQAASSSSSSGGGGGPE